jgi:hypothetical protein
MDTDSSGTEATNNEEAVPGKTGRPPPIIQTSTTILIQLQKQLRSALETEPESLREEWRICNPSDLASTPITCPITHTLCPKSENPMKAVIRHLPHSTPAEDISDGPVSLGFDVINVKQMTATRRSLS